MNFYKTISILIFLLLASITIQAQNLEDRVVEYQLENGMKFLLVERHQAPVISCNITFRVGGVDEKQGKTGIAHMFEHMAFKGTPWIGTNDYESEKVVLEKIEKVGEALTIETAKGDLADASKVLELQTQLKNLQEEHKKYVVKDELDDIFQQNGADGLNAGTSKDYTTYYVSLPSNRIELWALMESQRMQFPVLREFYSERDVILEERRMRYENDPGGKIYENFLANCYSKHPYYFPTIGWSSDIQNMVIADARQFRKKYYIPQNAVGAIVGNIDIENTKAILKRYFGNIKKGDNPPEITVVEPEQTKEHRIEVEFDAEPQVLIGYHKPTIPDDDDYIFGVVDGLLSEGRTSRFYSTIIKEKQIATSVSTFEAPGARYPNLFCIYGFPRNPHTASDLEAAIYEEIEKLKNELVPEEELQKVRNVINADFIRGLESNEGLARQLTWLETVAGDWKYVLTYLDRINTTTAEDVQRVMKKYFTPENRTVAFLVKPKTEKADGGDQ